MKGCLVSERLRSTGFGFLHFRLQSVDAVSFRLKVLDPQALGHCRVWAFGSLCFQVFFGLWGHGWHIITACVDLGMYF